MHSVLRKAGTEPALVHALFPPCLLGFAAHRFLLCTRPWVLQKVRPSFSLSSPSCVGTSFMASQQHPPLPAPRWESCRARAEGLWPAGCSSEPQGSPSCPFAAAASVASPWPCPGHHSAVEEEAGDRSSFYVDLVVFCPWGFIFVGTGGEGRTPDSRLKSKFHLSCISFSKTQHWIFL